MFHNGWSLLFFHYNFWSSEYFLMKFYTNILQVPTNIPRKKSHLNRYCLEFCESAKYQNSSVKLSQIKIFEFYKDLDISRFLRSWAFKITIDLKKRFNDSKVISKKRLNFAFIQNIDKKGNFWFFKDVFWTTSPIFMKI